MELPEGVEQISKFVAQVFFLLLVLAFTARYIEQVTVQRRRSHVVGTPENDNESKKSHGI